MTDAPIELQITIAGQGWPDEVELRKLADHATQAVFHEIGVASSSKSELSLLFTGDEAIRQVNRKWRGMDKPTNVLSFPAVSDADPARLPPVLGDIVFGVETIAREAKLEDKPFDHHLIHLIVHGLLHIFGYDHEQEPDAKAMEALEQRILETLAIPDPYGTMN